MNAITPEHRDPRTEMRKRKSESSQGPYNTVLKAMVRTFQLILDVVNFCRIRKELLIFCLGTDEAAAYHRKICLGYISAMGSLQFCTTYFLYSEIQAERTSSVQGIIFLAAKEK